jgi:CubicO group peptidase (beta-lactamase class C family)
MVPVMARRPRRVLGCALALLALLCGACSSGGGGTRDVAERRTVDALALERAVDDYFAQADTFMPELHAVRALLIAVDGRTVVARYSGSRPDDTHHVYGVTKSVVSTLIGIAIDQGLIDDVDSTLAELLPRYRDVMTPRAARVTLRDLLTMTSGFADEGDGGASWDPAQDDAVRTILQSGSVQDPGRFWLNSHGSTHLLTAVLAEASKGSVLDFARRVLFEPLGIRTRPAYQGVERLPAPGSTPAWSPEFRRAGFAWATDRQGVHVGGTLLKLTASDLLRFGQLHLDEGRWAEQQVVSAAWVVQAVRPIDLPTNDEALSYGYLWWLMDLDGNEAYAASGAFGQAVVIVPALRLVVAMASADDVSPSMDGAQLLPLISDVVIPHVPKGPARTAPTA